MVSGQFVAYDGDMSVKAYTTFGAMLRVPNPTVKVPMLECEEEFSTPFCPECGKGRMEHRRTKDRYAPTLGFDEVRELAAALGLEVVTTHEDEAALLALPSIVTHETGHRTVCVAKDPVVEMAALAEHLYGVELPEGAVVTYGALVDVGCS